MKVGHILYESIHMKSLEQANLQRKKINQWLYMELEELELAGIGRGLEWRVTANRKEVSFVVDGYVLNLDCADGCSTRGMYEIH